MLYPFVASFNDIPLKSDIYTFCAVNTNLLSDLLKTGLAVITLISEENWSQFFLHIVLRCMYKGMHACMRAIYLCVRACVRACVRGCDSKIIYS